MSNSDPSLRPRGWFWRGLALTLAVAVFASACSRVKVRAEGGSSSRTNWEIGVPF